MRAKVKNCHYSDNSNSDSSSVGVCPILVENSCKSNSVVYIYVLC
jgi:hypothetical protein